MTTTIKLGYHKASTLFKRLNSYARRHPLYNALTDLGRIYKTIYILTICFEIDCVKIQAIVKESICCNLWCRIINYQKMEKVKLEFKVQQFTELTEAQWAILKKKC